MDRLAGRCGVIVIAALLLSAPQALEGQRMRTTIGAGVASPRGDLERGLDTGFTVRGQAGLFRLGSLQGHGQFGYSRFGGTDGNGRVDVWNGGVGGRLWYRSVWAGANAFYLFGDIDNGFGFAPEVGARLGSFELVADYLFGDVEWVSVRLGLRF